MEGAGGVGSFAEFGGRFWAVRVLCCGVLFVMMCVLFLLPQVPRRRLQEKNLLRPSGRQRLRPTLRFRLYNITSSGSVSFA